MRKINPDPLKGKYKRVAEIALRRDITHPIEVLQNGKHRVLRLSGRHRKFEPWLIMGMLGPELLDQLLRQARRYAKSRKSLKGKVSWKPVSIAVKGGRAKVKVQFTNTSWKTITLRTNKGTSGSSAEVFRA